MIALSADCWPKIQAVIAAFSLANITSSGCIVTTLVCLSDMYQVEVLLNIALSVAQWYSIRESIKRSEVRFLFRDSNYFCVYPTLIFLYDFSVVWISKAIQSCHLIISTSLWISHWHTWKSQVWLCESFKDRFLAGKVVTERVLFVGNSQCHQWSCSFRWEIMMWLQWNSPHSK